MSHTKNGYDPAWVYAINRVLADRDVGIRITDVGDELWDRFIGPLVDHIEDNALERDRRAVESAERWRAIESAPLDGTFVWVFSAQWLEDADMSTLPVGAYYDSDAGWVNEAGNDFYGIPTHWMPYTPTPGTHDPSTVGLLEALASDGDRSGEKVNIKRDHATDRFVVIVLSDTGDELPWIASRFSETLEAIQTDFDPELDTPVHGVVDLAEPPQRAFLQAQFALELPLAGDDLLRQVVLHNPAHLKP